MYREKYTIQYKIPEKHKRKKLTLKNITISFFLKRFKRFFIYNSCKSFLEIEYLDDCDLQQFKLKAIIFLKKNYLQVVFFINSKIF
jgi:hypothetical protein